MESYQKLRQSYLQTLRDTVKKELKRAKLTEYPKQNNNNNGDNSIVIILDGSDLELKFLLFFIPLGSDSYFLENVISNIQLLFVYLDVFNIS